MSEDVILNINMLCIVQLTIERVFWTYVSKILVVFFLPWLNHISDIFLFWPLLN